MGDGRCRWRLVAAGLAAGSWMDRIGTGRWGACLGGRFGAAAQRYRAFDSVTRRSSTRSSSRASPGICSPRVFDETRRGLELASQGGARAKVRRSISRSAMLESENGIAVAVHLGRSASHRSLGPHPPSKKPVVAEIRIAKSTGSGRSRRWNRSTSNDSERSRTRDSLSEAGEV